MRYTIHVYIAKAHSVYHICSYQFFLSFWNQLSIINEREQPFDILHKVSKLQQHNNNQNNMLAQ